MSTIDESARCGRPKRTPDLHCPEAGADESPRCVRIVGELTHVGCASAEVTTWVPTRRRHPVAVLRTLSRDAAPEGRTRCPQGRRAPPTGRHPGRCPGAWRRAR